MFDSLIHGFLIIFIISSFFILSYSSSLTFCLSIHTYFYFIRGRGHKVVVLIHLFYIVLSLTLFLSLFLSIFLLFFHRIVKALSVHISEPFWLYLHHLLGIKLLSDFFLFPRPYRSLHLNRFLNTQLTKEKEHCKNNQMKNVDIQC